MALDPALYCEHEALKASCAACLHADALADPTRAAVTRAELHPLKAKDPERMGNAAPAPAAPVPAKRTARRT